MAEGEVLQLINSDNLEISEEDYIEVVTRKTAILISAACQIGAILGEADEEQEEAMRIFGLNLGVGKDLQEGKITLPLIHALQSSNEADRRRLVELITSEGNYEKAFAEVKTIIQQYQGLDYTDQRASNYIAVAKSALSIFPPSPTLESFLEIADYTLTRRT
jgi:octaprenyl-diphosphate synthase